MAIENVFVTNQFLEPLPVALVSGSIVATDTPSVQRTPGIMIVAVDGTVAAGARSVTISPSIDFVGSIQGVTVNDTTGVGALTWAAPSGDTLAAIAYTRTAGSLIILEVR